MQTPPSALLIAKGPYKSPSDKNKPKLLDQNNIGTRLLVERSPAAAI